MRWCAAPLCSLHTAWYSGYPVVPTGTRLGSNRRAGYLTNSGVAGQARSGDQAGAHSVERECSVTSGPCAWLAEVDDPPSSSPMGAKWSDDDEAGAPIALASLSEIVPVRQHRPGRVLGTGSGWAPIH